MKRRLNVIMFLCSLLSTPVLVHGQDSVRHQTLQSVEIHSQRIPSSTAANAPTQVATLEKMQQTGATQVADVLSHMAGITIKDYGGVGGVKTVSARGLGSQFSTLTIDGIAVTDCQNGQIDLGRYLVGNTSYIELAQGQHDNIFQTARAFASGSVINMESRRPTGNRLSASMEGGSFGYLSPTLLIDRQLGRKLAISLWGNYTASKGDYPFTIYYTQGHRDSTSTERRKNSEMRMGTLTGNLYYTISDRSTLDAKIHYNKSFHNLPGPATYYYIKASEHTEDDALLGQARYRYVSLDDRLRFQLVGKAFASNTLYEDTAANGASSWITNRYHQQEYYMSGALQYRLAQHLTASLSTDEALNRLQTNLNHDNLVDRRSSLNVVALRYESRRITASGNLLATLLKDDNIDTAASAQYRRVSPYLGASLLALSHKDSTDIHRLRVRYFFKENYRIPTFNELYYFTLRRELKPEKALQHNLGLTYHHFHQYRSCELVADATLDAYYNRVSDKIVAIPTQNLFLWSMINLGRVDIKGLDLSANTTLDCGRHKLSLSGTYSYQDARDMTDPADKTYDQQIPYTPRHSGGAQLYWNNPWADLGYSILVVGDRYRLGQNTADNLVEGYVDQGITLSRSFDTRMGKVAVTAQVLNLFDVQYEVVKSYPMMGRNYRLKISIDI